MSSADTHSASQDDGHDDGDAGAPIPRPRPGYRTPEPKWSQRLGEWAPVMASMLRTVTGVVAAAKQVGLSVPLVVRLEGTNVDLGKKILAESGLAITAADDMLDGAKKAVSAAGAA